MTDSNHNYDAEADAIAQLRNLLLEPEQKRLNELQQRLTNPELYAEDVSRVLPEAIILRSLQKDEQLTKALIPTVEEAIQASVRKDLHVLADAIFPVIGPAIRKSIATTLNTMLQSLNQALEHSFSVQSFKWRLEARQTGKSFAEVVLLRTLVYRVEQVFLIHKQTGLLLQHVSAPSVDAQDADLVSAMLTAIQDFVKDSFTVETGETLETLQLGELTIWIEQGPKTILAGVIRGVAPAELRLVFQNCVEKIHVDFQNQLTAFTGDNTSFAATQGYLEACLRSQYQLKQQKTSPLFLILLGSILFATGLGIVVTIQQKQRWANYINKLNSYPGIVVVNTANRWGKYYISGLRDPLAINPNTLIQQFDLNADVISKWEPYLSFDSAFITQRAKQLLQPPETVSLKVENGILRASGSAPRQWIIESRKLVRGISGVTQLQEDLVEVDDQKLNLIKKSIEKQVLLFAERSTQMLPNQAHKIQSLLRDIKNLSSLASVNHKNIHIQIIGRTDNRGFAEKNLVLSQARAYAILPILTAKLPTIDFSAVGVGNKQPLLNADNINRSVSFKVFLTDAPSKTSMEP